MPTRSDPVESRLADAADARSGVAGGRSSGPPAAARPRTRRIAVRYGFEDIPLEMELGEIVTRGVECGDIYTRHIDLPPGVDFTPLLVGLPEDRCQCPHWGYVLSGSIRLRFADDNEETSRAGDVFYWPAGHGDGPTRASRSSSSARRGDPAGSRPPGQAARVRLRAVRSSLYGLAGIRSRGGAVTDLTQNRAEGGAEGVEAARATLGRWHWAEALELARSIGVLDGRAEADRLDIVAEASWWLGRPRRLHRGPRAGLHALRGAGRERGGGSVRGAAL